MKRLTPLEWGEIKGAYLTGRPLKVLAKQYGIRHDSISRRAAKEGWGAHGSLTKEIHEEAKKEVIDEFKERLIEAYSRRNQLGKFIVANALKAFQRVEIEIPSSRLLSYCERLARVLKIGSDLEIEASDWTYEDNRVESENPLAGLLAFIEEG